MILGALFIVLCAGHFANGDECRSSADVVFVIDISSSISRSDFQKQILFVNTLIDDFNISSDMMQVACVTFSRASKIQFRFDPTMTKRDVKNSVNAIKHLKGDATYIYKGLSDMRRLFTPEFGHRPYVPKECIILTDGDRTDRFETPEEAKAAIKEGITIFVIGVGETVNRTQLEEIASTPTRNHVFLTNFDDLNSLRFRRRIAKHTCFATPSPRQPVCPEGCRPWTG